jgi:membrane fusion protein (multidrug efflux system)
MNTESPAQENSRPANGKRKTVTVIALICLCLAGLVFGGRWLYFRMTYTATDDAQVDGDLLPISSKVPGRIVRLLVKEGDPVKRGQLIAMIEDRDYALALERARAGLDMAERDLDRAEAALALAEGRYSIGMQQSEAGLGQADGDLAISAIRKSVNKSKLVKDAQRANINLNRVEKRLDEVRALADQAWIDNERAGNLYSNGVMSKAQYDQTRTALQTSRDRVAQVEKELEDARKAVELANNNLESAAIDDSQVAIAQKNREKAGLALSLSENQIEEVKASRNTVRGLEAKVRDMRAAVQQAEIAHNEVRIVSPVDGFVAKKISQPYEIVPAGKPIYFILDSSNLWVTANIEEKNLRFIKTGSRARVTVDAAPGKQWDGRVYFMGKAANSKFSLIPQGNTTGQFIKVTQRIPIKIRLDGDTTGLQPGMNAVIVIKKRK